MSNDKKSQNAIQDLNEFYTKLNPEMEPLSSPTSDTGNESPNTLKNGGKSGGKNGRKKCTDFDDILTMIGSEGKFQKIILYGVVCPFITVSPFLVLNNIFLLDIPNHWCTVPGMGNDTDIETWKNWTLPTEIGPDGETRYSQCLMYDPSDPDRNTTMMCNNGWTYDKTDYDSTIPSDFDWVCDKVGYATDTFTVGTLGSAIGTVVFGILADKIGRKPVYFATCLVNILFRTLSYFVPHHFWAFLTLQGLAGTAFPSIFSMPALIVAEICGAEYRSWTYAATWMIWVVGNSLLPFVAWACRTWFFFGIISALPGLFLFLYYPIITESPRWLITAGRGEEALQIIKKIAKTNRVEIDNDEMAEMVAELIQKQKNDQKRKSIGFWTLFQNYRLAKNTIFLVIAWSMNCLLYYGITLNTTSMEGNKFVNYFLLSIIELPSGYLAGVLVEKTGRRWTQAAFFLMCAISCVICAVAVVQTGVDYLVIVGALGIKFGITITSMVVYLQGAEIFPTQLRSTGSGLASTISSIIGITGPYIIFTGKFNASLPYAILGLISAVGLLSSVSLPETFRQHLPETVEQANRFGKGVKFWSYLPKPDHITEDNNNASDIEKLKEKT
ncbi:organic cation transporter protein [Folsomia candida]|uniref:Organic cation transporter 1 n=1 Tax=Folsomia candida TaxID=158441 RepID=A0A226E315_FOLCA|nr:organic cation transporter protein [Folsomia candida]OXA51668.1 Organic cation transporter 1 [Folsomia candida]